MSTPREDWVALLDNEIQAHLGHYKEFAERADGLGQHQVARFFRSVIAAETARALLYRRHLAEVSAGSERLDYYVCPQCGVALTLSPREHCPLCKTPGTAFRRIT